MPTLLQTLGVTALSIFVLNTATIEPQLLSESMFIETAQAQEIELEETAVYEKVVLPLEALIGNDILYRIADCESDHTHFKKDGTVLRGRVDPDDIGLFQINRRYHGKTAEGMGIDIYTLEGNIKFAKFLYEQQGTKPWSASKHCWKNS